MKPRVRHLAEAVIAAVFFLDQRVRLSFGFFTMLYPLTMLIPYIPTLIMHPERVTYEDFYWNLFTVVGFLGLVIAALGFAIFVIACIYFLKSRGDLATTGLYSMVRHPQYLGIMLMALGTSVLWEAVARDLFFAVIGYLLLAELEERHLLKEHWREYSEYRKKTPFIFPVSCPPRINEFFFSLVLAALIFIAIFLSGSLTTRVW